MKPANNFRDASLFKHAGESVNVLILAGGLGTRLRSVTEDRPKVLAPVCGRDFISYLLDQIIASGLRQVILSTGYKGDQVKETIGDKYKGLSIQYSQETEPFDSCLFENNVRPERYAQRT